MSERTLAREKICSTSLTIRDKSPFFSIERWALLVSVSIFASLPSWAEQGTDISTLQVNTTEIVFNPSVTEALSVKSASDNPSNISLAIKPGIVAQTTNRPPEFFGNVSRVGVSVNENLGAGTDITNAEGEQYEWVATDPDGDPVTYSVEGTQSECFDIEIDTNADTNVEFPRVKYNANTALGCSEVFDYETQSSYDIDLVASDGNGGEDTLGIGITILDLNDPPTIDDEILPLSVNLLVEESRSIDASVAASDQDGDTLGYRFAMSNINVASYQVDGSVVTVTGVATGSATLSIIVVDGTHSVTKNLPVEVKDTNEPPSFTSSSNRVTYSVFENSLKGTAIGDVPEATDEDQDVLSYEITGDGSDVFSVTNAGKIVVAKQSGLDYETRESFELTLTVLDGFGGTDSIELGILVLDSNDPPVAITTDPPDQQVGLGGSIDLDVANYFTDPDGDTLNTTAYSHAESVVTVTTPRNDIVTVTGENLGSTFVTITVDDGSAEASVTLKVTVVPNAPPTVANPIEDMQIGLHKAKEIPLEGIFADPDGDETVDIVSASTSDETVLLVSVVDNGATLWLFGRNLGEATVKVVGEDNYGGTASLEFTVTVEGHLDNDPPQVAEVLEDIYIDDVGTSTEFSVAEAFTDEEDETLEFSSESSDESIVLALTVDDDVLLLLSRAAGNAQVTVTATDSGGLSISQEFTVFVGAGPPELIALDAITLEEKTFEEVDLTEVFEEGATVGEATSSNTDSVRTLLWDDDATLAIIARKVGESIVSVSASNEDGSRFTAEIMVTVVESDNTEPTLIASLDGEVVDVGNSHHVDLHQVFEDPDDDQLTFVVVSENENLLHASVDGDLLVLEGIRPGRASISLQAIDATGLMTQTIFSIFVKTAPEQILAIGDISLEVGEAAYRIDLNDHFVHGDYALAFDIVVTNPNIVRASIRGNFLSMEGIQRGNTKLQVIARDSRDREMTQDVMISVGDSLLQANKKQSLAGVGRSLLSSVSMTLSDRFSNFVGAHPSSDFRAEARVPSDLQRFDDVNGYPFLDHQIGERSTPQEMHRRSQLPQSFEFTVDLGEKTGDASIWFSTNRQQFEGDTFGGKLNSRYLGFDIKISKPFAVGATVAITDAEGHYRFGTAHESYNLPLKTLVPYVHYTHDNNTSAWLAIGMGGGKLNTIEHTSKHNSKDIRLKLGLVGFRRDLFQISNLRSGVKGEYGLSSMILDTDMNDTLDKVNVSSLRVVTESTWNQSLGEYGSVTPFLNFGLANELGDGQTGMGFETEAGVRLELGGLDLDVSISRFNMKGNGAFSRQSSGLSASYQATESGIGPSVAISSHSGGISQAFDPFSTQYLNPNHTLDFRGRVETSDSRNYSYSFRYGIEVMHNRYVLTPFLRIDETASRSHARRVGVHLNRTVARDVGAIFELSFMAQRNSFDRRGNLGIEGRSSIDF